MVQIAGLRPTRILAAVLALTVYLALSCLAQEITEPPQGSLSSRLTKLEAEVGGGGGSGSLSERLRQLETRLLGVPGLGPIPPRLLKLEQLVNGPQAYGERTSAPMEGRLPRKAASSPSATDLPATDDIDRRESQIKSMVQTRLVQAMKKLGIDPIPDLESADSNLTGYRTYIMLALADSQELSMPLNNIVAVITVNRSGEVEACDLPRPSGDATIDETIKRSVKSLKLVPLPNWYHGLRKQFIIDFSNLARLRDKPE